MSLGSLDPSLAAVACSPSNLTTDAGSVALQHLTAKTHSNQSRCVLAILDSNMEVCLYTAVKSYLTGKWQKVCYDVTKCQECLLNRADIMLDQFLKRDT